jgi:hypothetical protein
MEANHRPPVVDMIDAGEECCTYCMEFFHRMPLFSRRIWSISGHEALGRIQACHALPVARLLSFLDGRLISLPRLGSSYTVGLTFDIPRTVSYWG